MVYLLKSNVQHVTRVASHNQRAKDSSTIPDEFTEL